MTIQEITKYVPYKIDKNFSILFDELQNIQLINRKSDVGFSEDTKMMITMRDGTSEIGERIEEESGGVSKQFFFTDFFDIRRHFKGYSNDVWYLEGTDWIPFNGGFTGNNFEFNSLKLPMMIDGTLPTEYINPVDSTEVDSVSKSLLDTTVNPVGKILFISDSTNNNQIYRGVFSVISEDTGTEYKLDGSGLTALVLLKAGAKYQIYDTLGEVLQVMNGFDYDKYYFFDEDGLLIENTYMQGLVTKNLRNVYALLSTQYVSKQIFYSNLYWTFVKGTLFYSSGYINNPFFYDFTGSATILGNKGGYITDLFVFKGKLVIGGSNFVAYTKLQSNVIDDITYYTTSIEMVSSAYGIKTNTLVDIGVDSYFITTKNKIYSLTETITGTLKATNVGKAVQNYINFYNYSLCSGFDGSRLFFYGQENQSGTGTMVVFDIDYGFWATYTGLTPSNILSEGGSLYLSDNQTDIAYTFTRGQTFDIMGAKIIQKISTKDIDLDNPFIIKCIKALFLRLENLEQILTVDVYMSLATGNHRKTRKTISIIPVDVLGEDLPISENNLSEQLIGGLQAEPLATYPFLKKIDFESDSANIWKIIIQGYDGSPFHINGIMLEVVGYPENQSYFSPQNTI